MTDVVVLGSGYVGAAVTRLVQGRGLSVVGFVRKPRPDRPELVVAPVLEPALVLAHVTSSTRIVVTFPPDGATDARMAEAMGGAASIAYVSSTGVYRGVTGVIDDTTPVPEPPDARVLAEQAWRAAGATVLRAPAIYGADRGIHRRIARGEFRVVGDGSSFTSRIHVEDLARLLLAIDASVRGETFVVGDLAPATQHEIASWVAKEWNVPYPPSIPREEAHETLRADRRIDPQRALDRLNIELLYPDYRSGMANTGLR